MGRTLASITVLGTFFALALGCAEEDGLVISNSARITSATLATRAVACTASATACTPSNMEGRVFSAGAMLGPLGPEAYSMTFLADSEEIINNPSDSSLPQGTLLFDLGSPTTITGLVSIPTADAMPNPPTVTRVEFNFDYLDTTFTLTGTPGGVGVDGEYTIRVAFRKDVTASDVGGGETIISQADKLVKAPGDTEWKWCDAGGCSTTRQASPYQMTELVNVAAEPPQEGNPNYIPYAISLNENLTVTHEQIASTTNVWTLDLIMTDAVAFTAAPDTFDTVQEVVDNFNLKYACSFIGCEGNDDGIKADFSITAASR